jgi:hypothetical protein
MAGPKIELARFNFNEDDIAKGASEILRVMKRIKDEQKDLKAAGKETSTQFVKNTADLKGLNQEYNRHIKALSATGKQAQKTAIREEALELVLNQEVKTIKEAREQNKLLNELRNDANVLTEKGQQELLLLNEALDRNNKLIKENVDAYTKQKINIGNYKEDIKSALEETNIFSGGLDGLIGRLGGLISKSQEAGGVGNVLGGALSNAGKGMLGFTKATLAFIATPIGAIIAVLVAAFLLIKNALDRNEESMNKLKKAFAPFQGILNKVMQLLEPLGEFLIDGIVFAMELAEQAIYDMQEALASILDFLGFEKFAQNVRDFNEALKQGA